MITSNRIWAVVPVKRFSAAKTRLAPVLDGAERAQLARLMFEDVLAALISCRDLFAGTLVVTSDAAAAIMAHRRSAKIVFDAAERGINAAIGQAVQHIHAHANAGDGLVVVPSDMPHVTRNAFEQAFIALSTKPSLAIAAATNDRGTNLFACRPANAISPCFGPFSFDRHLVAALQAGLAVHTLCVPELSLDIDRPEDLRTFLSLKTHTGTHAFLSRIPILDRIDERHNPTKQLRRVAAEVWS
jgi:2-phospho-L-lactate/phosphoenolpyruvate guanylyltransferase